MLHSNVCKNEYRYISLLHFVSCHNRRKAGRRRTATRINTIQISAPAITATGSPTQSVAAPSIRLPIDGRYQLMIYSPITRPRNWSGIIDSKSAAVTAPKIPLAPPRITDRTNERGKNRDIANRISVPVKVRALPISSHPLRLKSPSLAE